MNCKDVTTQAELDAALAAGECPHLRGSGYFVVSDSAQVRAYGSAQVTAYDSAQVTASGSAQVRAYGSAQVTAYGSAQVTASGSAQVTASGSAQVTAYGSAQVRAYGSAQVTATRWVVTTLHGKRAQATGGTVVAIPALETVEDWIKFYGVETEEVDGQRVAFVFKAVDDDWLSSRDMSYAPGSAPEAPDWDGGKDSCGGGLHFSPRPFMALSYRGDATKFLRCPVFVSEMAVITDGHGGANKAKAKRVVAPGCVEVDIDGEPV